MCFYFLTSFADHPVKGKRILSSALQFARSQTYSESYLVYGRSIRNALIRKLNCECADEIKGFLPDQSVSGRARQTDMGAAPGSVVAPDTCGLMNQRRRLYEVLSCQSCKVLLLFRSYVL